MSFLEQLQSCKTKLQHCVTVVTTPTGTKYEEHLMSDGTTEISQPLPSSSCGFVVDTKPDLQVATIIPGVHLGSQDVVQDIALMQRYSITHVLSLGIRSTVMDERITYKFVDLLDLPETKLIDYLDECFSFIGNAMENNGCVFVHCNAGISRSASIIIAYLMKNMKMSYQQAFLCVKEKRTVINPNPGFIQQLKEYEEIIANYGM